MLYEVITGFADEPRDDDGLSVVHEHGGFGGTLAGGGLQRSGLQGFGLVHPADLLHDLEPDGVALVDLRRDLERGAHVLVLRNNFV